MFTLPLPLLAKNHTCRQLGTIGGVKNRTSAEYVPIEMHESHLASAIIMLLCIRAAEFRQSYNSCHAAVT